jgi:hypothetical protein
MATGTTFRILPSFDGRYYGAYPNGDAPSGISAMQAYIFGHSLFTYDGGDTAPATAYTRTGTWMGSFAAHNSLDFNGQGDFGQITTLNTYWASREGAYAGDGQPRLDASASASPDSPLYAYSTNTTPDWASGDWDAQSWTHVYTMPSNFEQNSVTPSAYNARIQEQLDNFVPLLTNPTVVYYMHWQEGGVQPVPPVDATNMTSGEAQAYRDYTRGDYLTWFIGSQDITIAANPSLNYVTVPVGPVWADLWENEPYMQGLNSGVFFGDQSPHGTETMYFLAALICYRAQYGINFDPTGYTAPVGSIVNAAVLNNLPAIVNYMEQRLNFYNSNGVRVYL